MICCVASKFDSVWKTNKKGEVEQAMGNLPTTLDDLEEFKNAMVPYGAKPNIFIEPKKKEMNTLMIDLRKKFKANPDVKFLLLFCIAGHG